MKYNVIRYDVMCNDVMNEENLILKTVPGPSLHNQHLSQKTTDHNLAISSRIQTA